MHGKRQKKEVHLNKIMEGAMDKIERAEYSLVLDGLINTTGACFVQLLLF